MTGFNLPPGCNVSDLPGNTKENMEAEAAYEKICEELETLKLIDPVSVDEEWYDHLVMFIMRKMDEAFTTGYQQARADDAEAKQIAEIEKAAEKHWETHD